MVGYSVIMSPGITISGIISPSSMSPGILSPGSTYGYKENIKKIVTDKIK